MHRPHRVFDPAIPNTVGNTVLETQLILNVYRLKTQLDPQKHSSNDRKKIIPDRLEYLVASATIKWLSILQQQGLGERELCLAEARPEARPSMKKRGSKQTLSSFNDRTANSNQG